MLGTEVQIDVEIEHQHLTIVLHNGCIGSRGKGRQVLCNGSGAVWRERINHHNTNSQVSRIFRLINVEILVIVIYVFYTIWIAHTNLNIVLFRKRMQKYCFFMKKHSQIVQFDSQIVQIFLFSLQIAIFRYIKNPFHAGDRDAFKSGCKGTIFPRARRWNGGRGFRN